MSTEKQEKISKVIYAEDGFSKISSANQKNATRGFSKISTANQGNDSVNKNNNTKKNN